jgi:hypothetical protein
MKNIFSIILFFLLLTSLVSAAEVTGSFTITGEAAADGAAETIAETTVNESNNSYQENQISQIKEKEEKTFLINIKNFFKKVFSFFKNDYSSSLVYAFSGEFEVPGSGGEEVPGDGGSPGGGGGAPIIKPIIEENESCESSWVCLEWRDCLEGIQNRTCTDLNHCELYVKVETRECSLPEKPKEQEFSFIRFLFNLLPLVVLLIFLVLIIKSLFKKFIKGKSKKKYKKAGKKRKKR